MIKPRSGDFIKHKNFKDVCIKVNKINGPYSKRLKIKGEYWGLGFLKSWFICKTKLELDYSVLAEWLVKIDKETDCLRNSVWKEIINE